MGTYIALLRGINVGGKNSLPMKDLAGMFQRAGCEDVQTFIQSGNVVFQCGKDLARNVPDLLEAAILKEKKIRVPVVVRGASAWKKIIEHNPYLKGTDPKWLHVGFLSGKPKAVDVKTLDPERSAPDEFQVIGSEVYFKLPNGIGKSRLTSQYFDSKLHMVITIRNWSTVLSLMEMSRPPKSGSNST